MMNSFILKQVIYNHNLAMYDQMFAQQLGRSSDERRNESREAFE